MTEVHLPVVGGVSRKALIIGGVGSAAVVGLFLLRKRSSSTAAAGTDPAATDPNSGDYTDPGLQDTSQGPTYGATGYYDPNTGQWVYGSSGTGQAAATTNQQWAQNAISYLAGNSSVDTGALAAALGAYLAGQPVTTDQESLIDQAIAAEGYPPVSGPNGNPPGMNVSSAGTGAGGTGGSTGGVTGSGSGSGGDGSSAGTGTTGTGSGSSGWRFPPPGGLHAAGAGKGTITVGWRPVTGPQGQHPQSYTVAYGRTSGAQTWKVVTADTTTALTTQAGMTEYIEVWANGGPLAPPHAGPVKATAGK